MLLNAARATIASRRAARSAPDTAPARPRRFTEWRRSRPLVGGLLVILGGVEMFFSGQLDFGELHIQLGIEGLQATVIPIALVLLGILSIAMPVHRIFYGVLTLAVAVYSLVGVNLGGFFIGMILSSVGGIVVVSWAPRIVDAAEPTDEPATPVDDETPIEVRELFATEGTELGLMRRSARLAAAAAALLLVSGTTSGAAAAPAAWPWCIPLLMSCDEPTPTPTTTTTPVTPTVPGVPDVPIPGLPTPGTPTDPDDPAPEVPSVPTPEPTETVNPVPDDGAPVFTQPPAQLGSEGLSFTGLRGIEIVTVPLMDGSRVAALKISADSITIQGFALTVGHADTPALATTADTMTLSGNVQVYLNSLSGTTADGTTYTLGADTPPPRDGIAPGLLRVTLGLVGATADSIVYSNTDQQLVE